MSDSLRPHGLQPDKLLCLSNFLNNTRVDSQFPSPGDLPDLGIEPASLVYPALAGRFFTTELPGKPMYHQTPIYIYIHYTT